MKLKLPKIKIFHILHSLKYFYWLIIVLIIGASVGLGWFLYKNLYQTIASSEQIILLKQDVAPDTINIAKVEAVLEAMDKKVTADPIDWESATNPFGTDSSQPTPPPAETN